MSESGVIPPPEDRHQPRYVGTAIVDYGNEIDFIISGDKVRIDVPAVSVYLGHDAREEFMRLWCEAERQAEGGEPA